GTAPARFRCRAHRARAVRLLRAMEAAARARTQPRCPAVRRPSVLRRTLLSRDLDAPGPVPAHPERRAGRGRRCAAGLLLRARTIMGQPGLRLAGAAAYRLRMVARAPARPTCTVGPAAHRSLPCARGPLGDSRARSRCTQRCLAEHSWRAPVAPHT